MERRYDFWVVDLDGTLIDVDPEYITRTIGRVGKELGVDFSPSEAERIWRGFHGEPTQLLAGKGVDPAAFWQTYHEVEDADERAAATFRYPDAEVFAAVPAPVALVTHCQPYLIGPVMERIGIADWFDAIVCCNDDLGWKPDPGPIEHAVDALGRSLSADRGAVVGDTALDVGAAWNAGLDAIHIERHSPARRGCCVRADYRVTDLRELVEGIEEGPGAAFPDAVADLPRTPDSVSPGSADTRADGR